MENVLKYAQTELSHVKLTRNAQIAHNHALYVKIKRIVLYVNQDIIFSEENVLQTAQLDMFQKTDTVFHVKRTVISVKQKILQSVLNVTALPILNTENALLTVEQDSLLTLIEYVKNVYHIVMFALIHQLVINAHSDIIS